MTLKVEIYHSFLWHQWQAVNQMVHRCARSEWSSWRYFEVDTLSRWISTCSMCPASAFSHDFRWPSAAFASTDCLPSWPCCTGYIWVELTPWRGTGTANSWTGRGTLSMRWCRFWAGPRHLRAGIFALGLIEWRLKYWVLALPWSWEYSLRSIGTYYGYLWTNRSTHFFVHLPASTGGWLMDK